MKNTKRQEIKSDIEDVYYNRLGYRACEDYYNNNAFYKHKTIKHYAAIYGLNLSYQKLMFLLSFHRRVQYESFIKTKFLNNLKHKDTYEEDNLANKEERFYSNKKFLCYFKLVSDPPPLINKKRSNNV